MVLEVSRSEPTHANYDEDLCEIASITESDDGIENSIVLHDENVPHFGNVAVNNSSDVHFGNKTFYQGPVTIKQFLYAKDQTGLNGSALSLDNKHKDGKENGVFVIDSAINGFIKLNGDKTSLQTQVGKIEIAKCNKFENWLDPKNRTFILTMAVLVIILISTIIGVVVFLSKPMAEKHTNIPMDSNEQDKNTPIDGPYDPTVNLTLSGKLKIISRLEWVAQPPVQPAEALQLPVPYVIIMHTATENCSNQAECTFHIRYVQTFHIESRHWWDIGYNYLVGGDGFAYEGRGWKSEGAHSFGYNARSIGIAFIGTFNTILPPLRQIVAAQQLIKKGVELGFIAKDYKLLAARQLQTTQSPGKMLYENMKTWPHWSASP